MTIREIQELVCAEFGITMIDLLSCRRRNEVMIARHVAMWLASKATKASIPMVGRQFERDHTTVLNAIGRVNQRMSGDHNFSHLVLSLLEFVQGKVAA